MKIASITEAKNQLSALLDRVRHGESILIVDRGRPVARLEAAVGAGADESDGRLARLERQGLIRRGAADPATVRWIATPPPRPRGGESGLRALLEERDAGR